MALFSPRDLEEISSAKILVDAMAPEAGSKGKFHHNELRWLQNPSG